MKKNNYEKRIDELEKQITALKDQFLEDGEEMVNSVAEEAEEYGRRLGERFTDTVASAKEFTRDGVKKARQLGRSADHYAHDHPWQMVAGAAAVGILLGIALNRKK